MAASGSLVRQPPEPPAGRRTGGPDARAALLEPGDEGIALSIARRLPEWRPGAVYAAVLAAGYALLAAIVVGMGLLLTEVLLPVAAIQDTDAYVPEWMADNRRPWLTDASAVASRIGDVPVLPALVVLTLVVAAVIRRFRIGAFLLTAILIEVTMYRIGALAVPRNRPDVARLEDLPVDRSFPSGHAAASFVVYLGLAWLITARVRRRWVRVAVWTVALAAFLAVTVSRLYRGMHHPLDALSGALVGTGSLLVALIAVLAYLQAGRIHDRQTRTVTERSAAT